MCEGAGKGDCVLGLTSVEGPAGAQLGGVGEWRAGGSVCVAHNRTGVVRCACDMSCCNLQGALPPHCGFTAPFSQLAIGTVG